VEDEFVLSLDTFSLYRHSIGAGAGLVILRMINMLSTQRQEVCFCFSNLDKVSQKLLGTKLGPSLGCRLAKKLGPSLGIKLGPSLGIKLGPSLGIELGVGNFSSKFSSNFFPKFSNLPLIMSSSLPTRLVLVCPTPITAVSDSKVVLDWLELKVELSVA